MRSKSLFLIFQAFNISIFSLFTDGVQTVPLALSGMITLILYGSYIYGMILKPDRLVSPLVLFMGTSLLRIGIAPIFLAAAYQKGFGNEMFFVFFDPQEYLGKGYLLLIVGEWFFLAGYFLIESLGRGHFSKYSFNFSENPQSIFQTGLFLIILSWIVRFLFLYQLELSSIGRIFAVFRVYSSAAGIFFILRALRGQTGFKKQKTVLFIILLTISELAYAMQSYMKQDTIIVLLPIIVYYLSQFSFRDLGRKIKFRRIMPIAIVAYFVIMVLFPYSQMRRQESWQGKTLLTNVEVIPHLTKALAASIPGMAAFRNVHKFPGKGFWTFFSRNQLITPAAWAVKRVQDYGTIGGKTLKEGLVAIVPRIIWPEKPLIASGRDFAVVLGQAESFETATTSTGLGLAAAFYWNGGILLLVFGMFINGMILSKTWQIFHTHIFTNPIAMIVYIMLLFGSLKQFAGTFDGGIAFYAYIFIVLYPLMLVFQGFLGQTISRIHAETADKAIAG